MANYTPNLNLSKPENTDSQQSFISDYCDNMDKLDNAIGGSVTDVEVNGVSVVVDGVAQVTVPTQTSDLTNDSDFVSDANYVHTDNNFTSTEKSKLSGIASGAEVNVQSDWSQTDNTKDDFIKNKPTAENKSATTEFNTVNGGLLQKCIINLEPVQSGSGDPSPDNVRPFSGHTEVELLREGKNIWGGAVTIQNIFANAFPLSVTSGKVTISLKNASGKQINARGYDENRNIIIPTFKILDSTETSGKYTLTLTEKTYLNIIISGGSASDIPNVTDVQIEKGDQATSYEPYLGTLYTTQIGRTVYGCHIDFVRGQMIIDTEIVDMGNLVYAYDSANNIHLANVLDKATYQASKVQVRGTALNGLGSMDSSDLASSADDSIAFISESNNFIGIKCTRYVDLATSLSGQKIIYEIATPIILNLTPQQIETLAGQNNLSTPLSGQSIEANGVEYKELFTFADVKEYVDKKIPDAPTTDGTYTLQAVVSGGVPTYSWV